MKRIHLIPALLLFIGCTFTTTQTTPPKFKSDLSVIQAKVDELVSCEYINASSIQTTVDDERTKELAVTIFNASNVPGDMSRLKELAEKIAKEFKKELLNRGEFDIIKIYFVSQESNGNINSSGTKEVSFTAKDL